MSDMYESFKELSAEILSDITTGPARSTVLVRCDATGRPDVTFYVDDTPKSALRMADTLDGLARDLRDIHERSPSQDAGSRIVP